MKKYAQNLTEKIISGHLVRGRMETGTEIFLKVDSTLVHDMSGTLAYIGFEAMGIEIFRTDKQGTITVSTDGSSLTWSVSPCSDYTPGDPDDKPARPAGGSSEDSSVSGFGPSAGSEPSGTVDGNGLHTYILNTSSKLIHMPDCRSVSDMSDKNKAEWSGESFDQCLKENPGYRGCKSCNPS